MTDQFVYSEPEHCIVFELDVNRSASSVFDAWLLDVETFVKHCYSNQNVKVAVVPVAADDKDIIKWCAHCGTLEEDADIVESSIYAHPRVVAASERVTAALAEILARKILDE
jgi:hypothetical protein